MTAAIDQHATCQHKNYRLDCDEFAALLERADHACEVCGAADKRLHIDHEHGGPVRGLLCAKCNALLSRIDRGLAESTPLVELYRSGALAGIANKQTPPKNFRIENDLYADAKRIATARGETLTDVLVAAFERYRKRHAAELSDLPAKERA